MREYVIQLKQNGDFRSKECAAIMTKCDIVITNPPFSLLPEFTESVLASGKDFVFVGGVASTTLKSVFLGIMADRIYLGHTTLSRFVSPGGDTLSAGARWYTSFPVPQKGKLGFAESDGSDYPHYINLEGIDVGDLSKIPSGYKGIMGVPTTIFSYDYRPWFRVVGYSNGVLGTMAGVRNEYPPEIEHKIRERIRHKPIGGKVCYLEDGEPVIPFGRVLLERI